MPEARTYNEAQFEAAVNARLDIALQERAEKVWSKTVNGSLIELGGKIDELTRMVQVHIDLPYHAGTKALLDSGAALSASFGLDQLSMAERAAFPALIKDFVEEQRTEKRHAVASARLWQRLAVIASAATAVVALLAASGFFVWVRRLFGVGT